MGGRIVDFRWLHGEWDGLFVTEALDDISITAGMLKLVGAGNVTTQTMRAVDGDEMRQILDAAS